MNLHPVWFIGDTLEILISSHFEHTDRHTDYNVLEF